MKITFYVWRKKLLKFCIARPCLLYNDAVAKKVHFAFWENCLILKHLHCHFSSTVLKVNLSHFQNIHLNKLLDLNIAEKSLHLHLFYFLFLTYYPSLFNQCFPVFWSPFSNVHLTLFFCCLLLVSSRVFYFYLWQIIYGQTFRIYYRISIYWSAV